MLQAIVCVIFLWLVISHTINSYYPSTYQSIKHSQNSELESKLSKSFGDDTLVNLNNFDFVMNNASLCMERENDIHSRIVLVVHSERSHFEQRYAIRNTWGSIKVYKQWHLHLIFLLGIDFHYDPLSYTEIKLRDEWKLYGDIIMGNFVDSYKNVTYKHLMG